MDLLLRRLARVHRCRCGRVAVECVCEIAQVDVVERSYTLGSFFVIVNTVILPLGLPVVSQVGCRARQPLHNLSIVFGQRLEASNIVHDPLALDVAQVFALCPPQCSVERRPPTSIRLVVAEPIYKVGKRCDLVFGHPVRMFALTMTVDANHAIPRISHDRKSKKGLEIVGCQHLLGDASGCVPR